MRKAKKKHEGTKGDICKRSPVYEGSCRVPKSLPRQSDVLAADWQSETHVKNYDNFSRAVIRFFSGMEIPIKHPSLYYIIKKIR